MKIPRLMLRSTTVWLLCATVVGAALFVLKYRVIELEDQLAELNSQIVEEQEAIHILQAEWSYLNQPDYLQRVSQEVLHLQPTTSRQVVSLKELPTVLETQIQAIAANPPPESYPSTHIQTIADEH